MKFVFAIGSVAGFNGTVGIPSYPTITAHNLPFGWTLNCQPTSVNREAGTTAVTLIIGIYSCDPWTFDISVHLVSGGIS